MSTGMYGSGEQQGDALEHGGTEQSVELAFDNGDDQLPWLESDDDYEDQGVDTARVVIFGIIGLLVIAVVAGGIWWATRDTHNAELTAVGDTIEAPEGPYKTKPEDPGGKTFEGTGDTSFAVAEGQTSEGTIAAEPPRPSIDLEGTAEPEAPASPAPQLQGVGVQVGAYFDRASAERGWSALVRQFEALEGVQHRVVEGQADIGRVFRLQAVTGDLDAATNLCETLKANGGACQVKP